MRDLRQTKEYAKYMQLLGWSVVRCRMSGIGYQVFIKKIPLLGNIAKLQRPSGTLDPRTLDEFAKKHKLAAFYVEPTSHESRVASYDFQPAKTCFLPPKTIHIDLTKSEEQLLKGMKPKTRYNIKIAQKRGVIIKESSNMDAFIKLWHESARHRGMWLPQDKEIKALWTAFDKKAHFLLALKAPHDSSPQHVLDLTVIAGVFIVRTPTIAYYMYAASTKEGNKLSSPSLLVWEAINLAKRKGCKVFDFEGIYDDRYPQTKNWKGFTKFKEGFGGKEVTYPKTLVQYSNPFYKFLF